MRLKSTAIWRMPAKKCYFECSDNELGANMKIYLMCLCVLTFFVSSSSVYAYEVHGAIAEKWKQLRAESGPLGAPKSDELDAAGGGRHNDFQYGFIYWHPKTGAHAVYGLIGEKWNQMGRERGFGYPLTDEQPANAGGRFNDFTDGRSIYSHPRFGTHAIYGAIRDKWVSMGRELSKLGYPTSDEYSDKYSGEAESYRRVDFECGFIKWSPRSGAKSELCSTF